MDFSELCALVGALRDRVADLEAKEAERSEPIDIAISMDGCEGNREIQAMVEAGVMRGMAQGGPIAPGKLYTIGERGPETIVPITYDPFATPGAKAEWPKY